MKKKSAYSLFGALGLGFFCLVGLAGCQGKASTPTRADAAPSAPLMVNVKPVFQRTLPTYLETTGSISAIQSSKVAANATGLIAEIPIQSGDFVKEGATLARLDPREANLRLDQAKAGVAQAEAALKQAESRLGVTGDTAFDPMKMAEVASAQANLDAAESAVRLAESNFKRYEKLAQNDNIPRVQFDQARNQVETARANATAAQRQLDVAIKVARQEFQSVAAARASLEQARLQVALAEKSRNDLTIRSPFSGFVVERLSNQGEYVMPDTPVAMIVRHDPIKVQLQISETQLAKVKIGQEVSLASDAFPDRKFSAKVTALNPIVDQNARSLMIEAQMANPDGVLRPGMFVKARVAQPEQRTALFVPVKAVFYQPALNASGVYVIEGTKARLRIVQPGSRDGEELEILTGLTPEDQVVVAPPAKLIDGSLVEIQSK
ncbi:MAG TPA: efflux RND transporter periplasmic adaptor subunit [Acidobacteriota bacterium]|nr:efflux RND transporter periplasmic adaptor subunit [Acidobacteriota bacterium]HNB74321.1 efflux RND transporter periplasmic adaptor subunit [Acidobacteriota bacterium]HNH83939.1 efflux RND transporter periplasmic adaptor subunit [Acidobacteriota bacterium]HNJ40215.1 efflux RND transporter periplasmic adaptor subunit [Acidobacteriota bacterium]